MTDEITGLGAFIRSIRDEALLWRSRCMTAVGLALIGWALAVVLAVSSCVGHVSGGAP
jgi:hypothetical protein